MKGAFITATGTGVGKTWLASALAMACVQRGKRVAANLIQWANHQPAPILSLDVPSGIDTMTGSAYLPAIKAHATMTLALPKKGLGDSDLRSNVGELYLANISVPPNLYTRPPLNLKIPSLFVTSDVIKLQFG